MKVVVTIAGLHSEIGGPSRTVPALCGALASRDLAVELIAVSEDGSSDTCIANNSFVLTRVRTSATRYSPFSWRRQFEEKLLRGLQCSPPVLIYDVGLWLPSNHFSAQIAKRRNVPFITSPRGMLSPWALTVSKWKKRIAWFLYQKNDLRSARILHATSDAEARDFRTCGFSQPIAVVPNGIEIPRALPARTENRDGARTLLFLSRLHPIKGLKDLAQAWARVRPPGWRAIIAGPDEGNHQTEIESLLGTLGVRDDFEFFGPAAEEAKWNLYRSADLFVLPSYSESFGQVVGEALGCGVPVVTTQATPWRELEEQQCGWWIPTGADALTQTLADATSRSDAERRNMGERGRELVLNRYSWPAAAEKMSDVFEWVLGRENRPECVTG